MLPGKSLFIYLFFFPSRRLGRVPRLIGWCFLFFFWSLMRPESVRDSFVRAKLEEAVCSPRWLVENSARPVAGCLEETCLLVDVTIKLHVFTTPVEKCGTCSELAARRGKSEAPPLLHPSLPHPTPRSLWFFLFFKTTLKSVHPSKSSSNTDWNVLRSWTGQFVLQPRRLGSGDETFQMGNFYCLAVIRTQCNSCLGITCLKKTSLLEGKSKLVKVTSRKLLAKRPRAAVRNLI